MENSQELANKVAQQHKLISKTIENNSALLDTNAFIDRLHHDIAADLAKQNKIMEYEQHILTYVGHPAPSYYSWRDSILDKYTLPLQQPVNQ